MNTEEPYRNQAERLKRRIEKINENTDKEREQLPPREMVHRHKTKKTKLKLKYPVIRLLVLFFILLPIIIFSLNSYFNDDRMSGSTEKTSGNSVGYETINIEKSDTEDNKEKSVEEEDEAPAENEVKAAEVHQPVIPDTSTETQSLDINKIYEKGSDKNSGTQTKTVVPAASQPEEKKDTTNIIYHTVKPKETLYRISMNYYQSKAGMEIIKKANKLRNENIYVGQVLKIPLEK